MLSGRAGSEELPKGLDAAWDYAAASFQRAVPRTRRLLARAGNVLAMEKDYRDLSDARLRQAAEEMRILFRRGRQMPADLERAMALLREVAFRQRGERPFAVQVAGALAMLDGCIAEMATGEGKTLTATLPATVEGWCGRGCHIVTVNDYLARRDAEWMAGIYRFCGLTVAHVEQGMKPHERRAAYQADITYCTNKEVTADFLRDRLAMGSLRGLAPVLLEQMETGRGGAADRLIQRGLHFALVDEADSILIDEAVTPLIISGQAPNPDQAHAFAQAAELAAHLQVGRDFRVQPRYSEVDLTEAGKARLAAMTAGLDGIWGGARRREEVITQALTARQFYLRDKQYVIEDGKVVIVDEFTGRLMPDRTWREGLHQAIEAKEGLEINAPKDTYARLSFQRFFRMYRKLAGMTGTAAEAWREFRTIYRLPVAVIPTNRPCRRAATADRVFSSEAAKWAAILQATAAMHRTGRPVLVGTRSVQASEHLSGMLRAAGLEHQVLNAVRHAEEAQVVAGAGHRGRITVATNMAGRGTDIKLGGGVAELGGLHVIATERHESSRIDRQLFGRCARQGDPGGVQAFVSLEDELLRRHLTHLSTLLRRRYGGEQEITSPAGRALFTLAQRRCQRQALSQRKGVLRTDDWLDEYLGFAGSEM